MVLCILFNNILNNNKKNRIQLLIWVRDNPDHKRIKCFINSLSLNCTVSKKKVNQLCGKDG